MLHKKLRICFVHLP